MGTHSRILLIAISVGLRVLATAERCNDFGLRPDPTAPNQLIWEFYNFTDLDERRGCFLCVEIPVVPARFSRLILLCETPPVSVTLSGFNYGGGDTSPGRGINFVNNANDCQTAYNASQAGEFHERTPEESNSVGEVRIDEYSINVSFEQNRLYRIVTRRYSITQTVCIRSLTYTYSSTTSSTGDATVSSGKPLATTIEENAGTNERSPTSITTFRPVTTPVGVGNTGSGSPFSGSTGAADKQPRTTNGDGGLPIWVVAAIASVAVLICALVGFILAYRKRRTRQTDDRKEQKINKDDDEEGMVYNPVYASGSDTLDPSTSAAKDERRESAVYAGIEEDAKTDNDTDNMIYNDCYAGFEAKRGLPGSTAHDGHFKDSNDYEGVGETAKRTSRSVSGVEPKNVRWSLQKALNSVIPLYGKVDKNRAENDDPRKDDVANCDANNSGTSFRIDDEVGKNDGDYADVSAVRAPGDTSDEGSAAENSKARWSLKKTLNDVVPLNGKVDKNKKKRKEEVHPNNSAASTRQGSSDAPTKSSHSNLYADVRKEKK